MIYRVQYTVANQRRSTQVEAGSPHEAVVKFRCTRTEGNPPRRGDDVVSVALEPALDDSAWRG